MAHIKNSPDPFHKDRDNDKDRGDSGDKGDGGRDPRDY